MFRKFLQINAQISKAFDHLLPASLRQDGNQTFRDHYLPRAFCAHQSVYDLGGGSRPCVSKELKEQLSLHIIGMDIDAAELDAAPPGVYDEKIISDICTYRGHSDADVVVCQATLEHVPDTAGAIRAIASILRPSGCAYIFAPCRNAAFARLNLILPERIKRALLFTLFPRKAQGHDGFKAYYDRCTPSQIEALAKENGLTIAEKQIFWMSDYFTIFFPAHMLWRGAQQVLKLILRQDAAESFIYVLRKD